MLISSVAFLLYWWESLTPPGKTLVHHRWIPSVSPYPLQLSGLRQCRWSVLSKDTTQGVVTRWGGAQTSTLRLLAQHVWPLSHVPSKYKKTSLEQYYYIYERISKPPWKKAKSLKQIVIIYVLTGINYRVLIWSDVNALKSHLHCKR